MSSKRKKGFVCERCCSDATKVLDTKRRWLGKHATYRRHECTKCGWRWNTLQIYQTLYRELQEAMLASKTEKTGML